MKTDTKRRSFSGKSQCSGWEYYIPRGTSRLHGYVEAPNELAAKVLIFCKHPEAQVIELTEIPNATGDLPGKG